MTCTCSANKPPGKPDLPASVSPGWTLKSCEPVPAKPDCWQANYASAGTAQVQICAYAVEGGAFDALQRTPTEADAVKFQEGKYLLIVKWNGVTRPDITALVRAIQKAMKA